MSPVSLNILISLWLWLSWVLKPHVEQPSSSHFHPVLTRPPSTSTDLPLPPRECLLQPLSSNAAFRATPCSRPCLPFLGTDTQTGLICVHMLSPCSVALCCHPHTPTVSPPQHGCLLCLVLPMSLELNYLGRKGEKVEPPLQVSLPCISYIKKKNPKNPLISYHRPGVSLDLAPKSCPIELSHAIIYLLYSSVL